MQSDRNTFDALYRSHAPSVFRRAARLLASESDAREVVQDIFTSLWERPAQYQGRSQLTTFLYSMTTHACLNRIRDHRNRARLLREHLAPPEVAADPAISAEQRSLLYQALARLPEELAAVAVYRYVDELTHEDIARILGCSRRHVGNLIERLAEVGRAEESRPC